MNKSFLLNRLRIILGHTRTEPVDPAAHSSLKFFAGAGTKVKVSIGDESIEGEMSAASGPPIFIVDDGAIAFDEFIDNVRLDPDVSLIDIKTIETHVVEIIRHGLNSQTEQPLNETTVRSLLKSLREQVSSFEVDQGVPDLVLKIPEFVIGNVAFRPAKDRMIALEETIRAKVGATRNTPEEQEAYISQSLQLAARNFPKPGSVATTTVRSSAGLSHEVATTQIRRACALLQFIAAYVFPGNDRRYSIQPSADCWSTVGLSIASSPSQLFQNLQRHGADNILELGEEQLQFLEDNWHLDTLRKIFDKEDWNGTEEAHLGTAFWWLSRSSLTTIRSESLLFTVIATEKLLFKPGETSTKDKWEQRVLWLVGLESPDDRLDALRLMEKVYDSRSRIVHAGLVTIDVDLLERAKALACRCLHSYVVLTSEGKSQAAIIEILDASARGF